jgi:hypothetical protein
MSSISVRQMFSNNPNKHDNYIYLHTKVEDLPRFNDLERYHVTNEHHSRMIDLEIDRLISVSTIKGPLLFDSNGDFGDIEIPSYTELSNLADMILCDLSAVVLDNILLVVSSTQHRHLISLAAQEFPHYWGMLKLRYREKTGSKGGCKPPQHLEDGNRHTRLYFALVDYITAICARYLIRIAVGDNWAESSIGLLAQLAVKLKFLSKDSHGYSRAALDNAGDTIFQFEYNEDAAIIVTLKNYVTGKDIEAQKLLTASSQP